MALTFISLITNYIEHPFHVLICHPYIFFGKVVTEAKNGGLAACHQKRQTSEAVACAKGKEVSFIICASWENGGLLSQSPSPQQDQDKSQ